MSSCSNKALSSIQAHKKSRGKNKRRNRNEEQGARRRVGLR